MATLASAAFTTSTQSATSCEVQLLQRVKAPVVLPEFLEFLDACIQKNKDRDDRSEGGWRPEVDRIFKATGRTGPELAFLAALRAGRSDLSRELPSLRVVQLLHVQPTLRRVLYTGALHTYDRWFLEAQNLTLEMLGEGRSIGCKSWITGTAERTTRHDSHDLWLHPQIHCLVSVCKAEGNLPTFVTMKLRMESFQQLVMAMKDCGYQHFKVSRMLDGAMGPLGDKASDWRLGLAWRNASSVLGDSMAVQRASMPLLLHAALPSRKNLALCLSGQLRGRNSVADLQWVKRFGSFDIFAVVPLEDCQQTKEILAELDAEVLCVDSLFMNPEELQWIFKGPKADPDICPGHHCVYVWRDVETCGRLLRRHMARFRTSYWRVARMRLDLRMDIFPKVWKTAQCQDVMRAFADDQIWAYAIPDRQWIATPDRFAIGPSDAMDVYFSTYSWMLNRQSWRHYDPAVVQACQRRGHLWLHEGQVRSLGKIWPCPEHSARGLAYQGPENVLEARLFSYKASITFRLRQDICFNQFAKQPGRILDSACETRPRRHPHGYWKTSMKHDHVQNYMSRQVSAGSEKLETRLLPYDALFTARLAEFLLEEWGEVQRPPKTLHLGAGRGAIAEQLSRWGLPVASIDGNCLVLALSSGLCLDVVDKSWMDACKGEAAGRGFCRWLDADKGSDWVLALNLIRDIPRHLVTRLATRLASGHIIVISWMPARRLDHLKMRHLLQHLRLAGYKADRPRSRDLQLYGGLLCCPWNQNTLVLRKRRVLGNCHVHLLEQLPESRPCVLQQNYGCIEGGIWVHFGCRGRFGTCHSGLTVSCESENDDYMECSACTDGHDARPRPMTPQMVGRLQRSDFVLTQPEVVSVNSSYFTQLFGLPMSHLYEAMDPLTTETGIWKDQRATTVLLLRAVKLAVLGQLGSYGLGTFRREWRYATWLRGCQHPLVEMLLQLVAAHEGGVNWVSAKEFLWQGIGFNRFGGFTFTKGTLWARYIYRFAYHASATV